MLLDNHLIYDSPRPICKGFAENKTRRECPVQISHKNEHEHCLKNRQGFWEILENGYECWTDGFTVKNKSTPPLLMF